LQEYVRKSSGRV